ncbi:hypothetical protein SLS62_001117 [Diatrype stigma]|uniref:GPR1/FUN34/YaaH-class plasma membrane protein n=1 Tax=Diatrype stigma TaxID=117547 RepID=A0AAN9V049_9PEZI
MAASHDASSKGSSHELRAAHTLSVTPEMFEKMYLSPQNQVKGDLRKTFANPTPIGLVGFLMCLTPLSCNLMGWRGASGAGAAHIPVFFFMGGVQMVIASVLEWILGNSFSSVVFITFGTFWLAFGGTLNPSFAAYAAYAPEGEAAAAGMSAPGFNASIGFWILWFNVLCFIFLILSLRTNIVFVILFFTLVIGLGLLTGAYWLMAEDIVGNAAAYGRLLVGSGAANFVCAMSGWYLLFSILLTTVDFPIQLPVGDLSGIIKGKSEKEASK